MCPSFCSVLIRKKELSKVLKCLGQHIGLVHPDDPPTVNPILRWRNRQTTHFGHESVVALCPASSSLIKPPPWRLFSFHSWPVGLQNNSEKLSGGTRSFPLEQDRPQWTCVLSFFSFSFVTFSLSLSLFHTTFRLPSEGLANFKKTQALSCWKKVQLLLTELTKPLAVICWNRRQMTASHVFLTVPLSSRGEAPSSSSPSMSERNFCCVRSARLKPGEFFCRDYYYVYKVPFTNFQCSFEITAIVITYSLQRLLGEYLR